MTAVLITIGQLWIALVVIFTLLTLWCAGAKFVQDFRHWERGYDARQARTIERLADVHPIRARCGDENT